MSSTDSSSSDHAYFRVIEECFIRLRGAPLLLSPSDWQLVQTWHQQGIPLDLVLETLETVFALRQSRGAKGRVQGLRYCSSAVEKAWSDRQELQATAERHGPAPIDVSGRLADLLFILSRSEIEVGTLTERIAELQGSAESVEASLADLDLEMINQASAGLDAATATRIRQSVEVSMSRLQPRLEDAEVSEVQIRLFREAVRRHLDLPVLSLFSDVSGTS